MFTFFFYRVKDDCPRLLINREKVGQKAGIFSLLGVTGGMDFDGPDNTRDVAWLGDCDEGCRLLAEKLGFGVSFFVVKEFPFYICKAVLQSKSKDSYFRFLLVAKQSKFLRGHLDQAARIKKN